METQRSPNTAGSGERLPGTGWSFLSFDPLPQRLAAGDSFHGELARTRDALRGDSPLHRNAERARKDERTDPERRDQRAESRSEDARRSDRPARRAERAEARAPRGETAARARRESPTPEPGRIEGEPLPSEPELAREVCVEPGSRPERDGPELDPAEALDARQVAVGEVRAAPVPAAQRPNERRAAAEGPTAVPVVPAGGRPELDSPRRRVAASAETRPGAERAEQRRAEEVLRQFRDLLHPTLRNATLQLEPRELGKLTIRIALHEGQLAANVRAERAETLELLKKHLPELRAALASAGIQTRSLDLELGAEDRGAQHGAGAQRRVGSARAEGGFEDRLERARPIAPRSEPGLDTWA